MKTTVHSLNIFIIIIIAYAHSPITPLDENIRDVLYSDIHKFIVLTHVCIIFHPSIHHTYDLHCIFSHSLGYHSSTAFVQSFPTTYITRPLQLRHASKFEFHVHVCFKNWKKKKKSIWLIDSSLNGYVHKCRFTQIRSIHYCRSRVKQYRYNFAGRLHRYTTQWWSRDPLYPRKFFQPSWFNTLDDVI